jgi:hypothetical protein
MSAFSPDVTGILQAIEQGDAKAAEQLLPLVEEAAEIVGLGPWTKGPRVRRRLARVRRPGVNTAAAISRLKRWNEGVVKAGANASRRGWASLGRIMTGRPWSRAQGSVTTSYATAKAACENCISRAEALAQKGRNSNRKV